MLRCVVLRCVMLRCVMLSYMLLRCMLLRCVMLHNLITGNCIVTLCYVMLYRAMLCHVMLYDVMLCDVTLCDVMLCQVMLYNVTLWSVGRSEEISSLSLLWGSHGYELSPTLFSRLQHMRVGCQSSPLLSHLSIDSVWSVYLFWLGREEGISKKKISNATVTLLNCYSVV